MQKKLRTQGMRNVYGLGFQVTTNGVVVEAQKEEFTETALLSVYCYNNGTAKPCLEVAGREGRRGG